jgi:hypothetical protein
MKKDPGTYYGLINGLITLIPVFPIWSLLPVALISMVLQQYISCKTSFSVILCIIFLTWIVHAVIYFNRINTYVSRDKKDYKADFRFFCFKQYVLINSFFFILLLGEDSWCRGDGQSGLVAIFSGPIASVYIFFLGIIFDSTFKKYHST